MYFCFLYSLKLLRGCPYLRFSKTYSYKIHDYWLLPYFFIFLLDTDLNDLSVGSIKIATVCVLFPKSLYGIAGNRVDSAVRLRFKTLYFHLSDPGEVSNLSVLFVPFIQRQIMTYSSLGYCEGN